MAIDLSKYKLPTQTTQPGGIDLSKYKTQNVDTTPQPQSIWDKMGAGLGNLEYGAVKGITQASTNLASGLATGLGWTASKIPIPGVQQWGQDLLNKAQAVNKTGVMPGAEFATAPSQTGTEALGQAAGYIGATTAEFLAPGGIEADITKSLGTMIDGLEYLPKIAQTALKIGSKALVSGISGGSITAAQTGSSQKAIETGQAFATLTGAFGLTGETLKSLGIPEALYTKIFKTNYNEVSSELNGMAAKDLQKADPAKYADYIKRGIIRVAEDGKVKVNDSIAKKALNAGLWGSLKNMGKTVMGKLFDFEAQTQDLVKNTKGTINLGSEYDSALKDIKDAYQGIKNPKTGQMFSDEAQQFISKLVKQGGDVSAEDALQLRRFVGDFGNWATKAGNAITKPSLTAQNMRTLYFGINDGLYKLSPELGDLMSQYKDYINMGTALTKAGVKAGNNAFLNMAEPLLFLLNPELAAAEKGIKIPAVATGLGQLIQKGSPGLEAGIKGLTGTAISGTGQQQ